MTPTPEAPIVLDRARALARNLGVPEVPCGVGAQHPTEHDGCENCEGYGILFDHGGPRSPYSPRAFLLLCGGRDGNKPENPMDDDIESDSRNYAIEDLYKAAAALRADRGFREADRILAPVNQRSVHHPTLMGDLERLKSALRAGVEDPLIVATTLDVLRRHVERDLEERPDAKNPTEGLV